MISPNRLRLYLQALYHFFSMLPSKVVTTFIPRMVITFYHGN